MVYRLYPERSSVARTVALIAFLACVALIGVAFRLTPDPSGTGSHEQLGFPPCTMLTLTGYPCPTCGMSTAFAHAVRGELLSAFQAQPAGLALAVATIAAAGIALSVMITGKVWAVNWYRVSPTRVVLGIMLLLAVGWFYKLVIGVLNGSLPAGR